MFFFFLSHLSLDLWVWWSPVFLDQLILDVPTGSSSTNFPRPVRCWCAMGHRRNPPIFSSTRCGTPGPRSSPMQERGVALWYLNLIVYTSIYNCNSIYLWQLWHAPSSIYIIISYYLYKDTYCTRCISSIWPSRHQVIHTDLLRLGVGTGHRRWKWRGYKLGYPVKNDDLMVFTYEKGWLHKLAIWILVSSLLKSIILPYSPYLIWI